MLSLIFVFFVTISVICALFTGRISELSSAITDGADKTLSLSIGLVGIICLWSGIIEIMKKSGLLNKITKILTPILKLLFNEVKDDKDIIEAISANITANLLGLSNAATPIGLKAAELICRKKQGSQKINSLYMLVLINTASLQLIPTTIVALRNSFGAVKPYSIIPAVWCASACALLTVIAGMRLLRKFGN